MARRKKLNYINNPDFLQALKDYKAKCREAEAQGKPLPQIPNYIGECINKISTRLATRSNFSGYPFKEEMISDGIENAIKSVDNFDSDKFDNPLAYFTMVIWNSFIRRIGIEKKELYTKYKISASTNNADVDNDYISDFIESYEENLAKKSKAGTSKKKKGLENFYDENEENEE